MRLSAATGLSLGASGLLAACGGKNETPAAEAPVEEAPVVAASCDDLSGLSDAEIQLRTSLQYVGESPNPDKACHNCALFVKPEGEAACGACTLIKGPIAPVGTCSSWAPVTA